MTPHDAGRGSAGMTTRRMPVAADAPPRPQAVPGEGVMSFQGIWRY